MKTYLKSLFYFLFVLSQSAYSETHMITLEEVIYDNSTGTILQYNGIYKDIAIPQHLNGRAVKIIGYKAFYGKELTSVTIANSVHRIEPFAFSNNLNV